MPVLQTPASCVRYVRRHTNSGIQRCARHRLGHNSKSVYTASGAVRETKLSPDLTHAEFIVCFTQHCPRRCGNVSISTSNNKKGYKTRSTRNDIAHVNEMSSSSIIDPPSSVTWHAGPEACVRSTRRSPINQNFHSGSTSMAQGTGRRMKRNVHL